MPPLDTGSVVHIHRLVDPLSDRSEPSPAAFDTVGAYLKAVRERRGRTLVDLAAATRVRRVYLAAIEDGEYGALPSRPFSAGYVRAYAAALDLDGEAAAERFKAELPDPDGPALRAPVGVKHDHPERRPMILVAAGVVLVAVVAWNIVQRAMVAGKDAAPPPVAAVVEDAAPSPAQQGPIALGAPTPPPADQTTPAPYVTPGLGDTGPSTADPTAKHTPGPATVAAGAGIYAAPARFEADGTVYGVPAGGPAVVLQARKNVSLIVRGPAGQVYFARQLKSGESYRAPLGRALAAEVSDPSSVSIYINDQLRGGLLSTQTQLDKVATEIVAHAPGEPHVAAKPAAAPRPATPVPTAPQPAAPAAEHPSAPASQAAPPVQ